MIKIIAFVDSFKHYNEPINEFLKRLGKKVNFVKLKPSNNKEIDKIISYETKELEKILSKTKGYKILLSIEGEEFSTNEFLDFIDKKEALFGEVVFIIGGAYGINLNLIEKYINLKLSFSKMTFPHSQAIMMLLEQIYRITSIKKGGNYHH